MGMRGGSRSDRSEEMEGMREDLGGERMGMKGGLLMGEGEVERGVRRCVVVTKDRGRCEMVRKLWKEVERSKKKGRGFLREVAVEGTNNLVGKRRVLEFPKIAQEQFQRRSSRFLDPLKHLNFHPNQIVDYSHSEGTLVIESVGIDRLMHSSLNLHLSCVYSLMRRLPCSKLNL